MDILAAWVLFPLALLLLAAGCGLAVERAAGRNLPGALVVPVGFALLLALGNLLTFREAVADLALLIMVVVAVVGFVVGRGRLRPLRIDRWAAAAAIGVFAVFGAPAALTGEPTFSGSLVLPDTANQLILGEHVAEAGPTFEGLPPSSRQQTLTKYLATEYPIAAQATLGVVAPLGLEEPIWLYQAFLSFMAAMTALALYAILGPWVARRWLRAGGAFVAAQPALAVSFALQGSIKETAGVTTVYLLAALVAVAIAGRWPARAFVPAAVTAAAALGALGPAALAYVGPFVLVLAVSWLRGVVRAPSRGVLGWGAAALAAAAVLAIPVLSGVSRAYQVNSDTLSQTEDLGNLATPLNPGQAAGVWLGGDFRYLPADHRYLTFALIGIVGGAAVLGLIWAIRRRALGPLLLILVLGIVSAYLLRRGSPYADAKVLMLASPAVLLAAVLGVAALAEGGRRGVEAALLGAVLGLGVLGSNALAYHNAQNAPHDRYSELLDINDRFAGEGPALLTEYDEYAGYLLRDMRPFNEPEYQHEFRGPPERNPSGLFDTDHRPSVKTPLDLDDLTIGYVQSLPTVILRRSPNVSRPPANFRRAYAGRYYEVWRRDSRTRVQAHIPLGRDYRSPGGVADCGKLRALGARARRDGGRLAYVARPRLVSVDPLSDSLPLGWIRYGGYPGSVVPSGPGVLERSVSIPSGGRVKLWLEGAFSRSVGVEIDGRKAGEVAYENGNPGQYLPVADVRLAPGVHRVRLIRGGGDLRPGNGGDAQGSGSHIGPLVFSPPANEQRQVRTVAAAEAGSLCGSSLDWVELIEPRAPRPRAGPSG